MWRFVTDLLLGSEDRGSRAFPGLPPGHSRFRKLVDRGDRTSDLLITNQQPLLHNADSGGRAGTANLQAGRQALAELANVGHDADHPVAAVEGV